MTELKTAKELFSTAKRILEEQEKNKAIEKFIVFFNNEASNVSNRGEFGFYIPEKTIPQKYSKEIIALLEDKDFYVSNFPFFNKYFVSWGEDVEEEE